LIYYYQILHWLNILHDITYSFIDIIKMRGASDFLQQILIVRRYLFEVQ